MTRDEFFSGLRLVIPITLAAMAASYGIITCMLIATDFKDASLHYTLTTVFPMILTPATVFPLVVMSHRLRRVKSELEGLLRIDTLTELPNRRAFFEFADGVFAHGRAVSVMMIDIDHFKSVNDRFGHDTGDVVLRAVAQSINRIVGAWEGCGGKIAARIGGEEFGVLVEGLAGEAATKLANEIVERMRQFSVSAGSQTIAVTVSIGVAHRRPGESADEVLRTADRACYRAKRLGRNQWCAADGVAERPLPAPEPMVTSPIRMQLRWG